MFETSFCILLIYFLAVPIHEPTFFNIIGKSFGPNTTIAIATTATAATSTAAITTDATTAATTATLITATTTITTAILMFVRLSNLR